MTKAVTPKRLCNDCLNYGGAGRCARKSLTLPRRCTDERSPPIPGLPFGECGPRAIWFFPAKRETAA